MFRTKYLSITQPDFSTQPYTCTNREGDKRQCSDEEHRLWGQRACEQILVLIGSGSVSSGQWLSLSDCSFHVYVCMLTHFIHTQLFVTPWTVARQAPLSMGFSRKERWSGQPFPFPGDRPDQGWNPDFLHVRQILYHLSHQGSPK